MTLTKKIFMSEEIKSRLLDVIWSRMFCLPLCYLKKYKLKYTKLGIHI